MNFNKLYRSNKYFINGFLFGVIACLSQVNLKYGIPLSLLVLMWLNFDRLNLRLDSLVKILVVTKFTIILTVWFIWSNKDYFSLLQILSFDVALFVMLSFKEISSKFIDGMFYAIGGLFFIDVIASAMQLITASDITKSMRVGDLIPRTTGILNSPIASVNIGFIFSIYSLYLNKKPLGFIGFAATLMTGAIRAPLLWITYISGILLVKYRVNLYMIFACCSIFVVSVFFLVSAHSNSSAMNQCLESNTCEGVIHNGSALRIAAWENAAQIVVNYPLHGFNEFSQAPFYEVDIPTIVNKGVAESTILQYMVDWGVGVGLIQLLILTIFFVKKRSLFLNDQKFQYEQLITTALAFACLLDSIFSITFTSFLVVVYLGILIIYMPMQVFQNTSK